jgi:G:T-mismatch repair DNA endonuclease (very short patch repair protein)
MALRFADKLRDDERLVVVAVARCGLALQYASARLRAKPDVVLLAAHPNVTALRFCSHDLLDNEGFASAAIHRCGGECLQFFSHRLRGDVGIVSAAVRTCGLALAYARPLLWSDLWVVATAVQQNGAALLVAAEALCDNESVVKLALQNTGLALRGASARLRDHPDFVELAIRQQSMAMEAASPRLADDYAFVRSLVDIDGDVLAFASPRLRSDRSLALAAAASAKFAFELHHLRLDPRLLVDDELRVEMALRNQRNGIGASTHMLTQELRCRIANGMTVEQTDAIAALCGSFAARLPRNMDDDVSGPLRLLQELDAPFGPLRAHRHTQLELVY